MNNIEVRVYPLKSGPKAVGDGSKVEHVAMASITLGGIWAIENVRVLRNVADGRCFASLPSYKRGDKWADVAHPITKEANQELQDAVAAAAAEALAKASGTPAEDVPVSVTTPQTETDGGAPGDASPEAE